MANRIRLFISHASADLEFVTRLVELLRAALNLPASAIRCTSVDGYRLPGGADTDEQLRREVHEAEAFVGVLSTDGLRSQYVLFELGARWGAGKPLVPLLAPGTPASALGGPLRGLNALSGENAAQLHQLLTEIGSVLSIPVDSAASYQQALERVLAVQRTARTPDAAMETVSTGRGALVSPPPSTATRSAPTAKVSSAPSATSEQRPGAGDTQPPKLVAFEILSPIAEVRAGPAQVELQAHLVDDLSGVAGAGYNSSPTQVRFRSPTKRQFVDAMFDSSQHLKKGTAQDGRYRSILRFPQFAEAGSWRVEYFLLVDQVGNSVYLKADEMEAQGFPTTVDVRM